MRHSSNRKRRAQLETTRCWLRALAYAGAIVREAGPARRRVSLIKPDGDRAITARQIAATGLNRPAASREPPPVPFAADEPNNRGDCEQQHLFTPIHPGGAGAAGWNARPATEPGLLSAISDGNILRRRFHLHITEVKWALDPVRRAATFLDTTGVGSQYRHLTQRRGALKQPRRRLPLPA